MKTIGFGEKIVSVKHDFDEKNGLKFQTETALIYDAVHLFAQALNDLDHSQVRTSAIILS
jgi:hypothetical protein